MEFEHWLNPPVSKHDKTVNELSQKPVEYCSECKSGIWINETVYHSSGDFFCNEDCVMKFFNVEEVDVEELFIE